MTEFPLVSCIMPTRDRRAFVPLAVECFLAQDYPHRELVVLDDGEEAVGDLLPDDPRIRYERLGRRLVIGAKRNRACGLARGELIAHWDDDDWSAPGRLTAQVEALERGGAVVAGLRELLFLDPVARRAWRYSYPARSSRPWVAGGSLCYRRGFWKAHPFQEVSVGEDTRFVWARGVRVVTLDRQDLYVAMMHRGNTSAKRPRAPRWSPARVSEVERMLGAHATAYRGAASGRAPAAKAKPDPRAGPDHVTVTIPYHRCREHIRACVESVLAQTHRELTVVVVNDGDPEPPWDLLADIDDARLVRFELARNRGRYFADQVVLTATAAPYLLIHDADDWSEPSRVAVLLERLRTEDAAGAISAARRGADRHGPARIVTARGLSRPPGERFAHIANLHGLFRTDALRAIGGFYAGFVVGYDSFLINALAMTGHVAQVEEPLYYWRARTNSLTSSSATGMGSELRRHTTRELQRMYRSAYRAYLEHHEGTLGAADLAESIRTLVLARVGSRVRAELEAESARLGEQLRGSVAPGPTLPAPRRGVRARASKPTRPVACATVHAKMRSTRAPTAVPAQRSLAARRAAATRRRATAHPRAADVYDLLQQRELSWGQWAISKALAVELAERLEARRPRRILELGSGLSTAVLAIHAAAHSAEVVTLEHLPVYATRTRRLLARLGLAGAVDLRRAPLRELQCADGRSRPWYHTALDGGFDFVLADGPPYAIGREATMFAVKPLLSADWELWLDDAHRKHERDCLQLWERRFSFHTDIYDVDEKGVAVLGPRGHARPPDPAPVRGLAISVLTGGRPQLLRQTLEAFQRLAPRVLRGAHVLVHVNGQDPESEAYARGLPFVDRVSVGARRLRIGPATSRVVEQAVSVPGVRYLMHLEDDWTTCTLAAGWLQRGIELLSSEERIGQVRLRHRSEGVLKSHMLTGRPIAWTRDGSVLRSESAHFTFNPSLVRAADVARLFPCADERGAQKHFLEAGWSTAQLSPGVFRHIGGQASLRTEQGRR